ncbi:MAG: TfoX/Sxy family protein [Bryobacteraceae bacterium]
MPRDDRFIEFVKEQTAILGEITSRIMFGGACLYCDGLVFALVADGAVFLKADKQSVAEFQQRGLKPFKPFPDRDVTMSYYESPPEIFEDGEALRHWCGLALEASRRAAKPKKKRKAKK